MDDSEFAAHFASHMTTPLTLLVTFLRLRLFLLVLLLISPNLHSLDLSTPHAQWLIKSAYFYYFHEPLLIYPSLSSGIITSQKGEDWTKNLKKHSPIQMGQVDQKLNMKAKMTRIGAQNETEKGVS